MLSGAIDNFFEIRHGTEVFSDELQYIAYDATLFKTRQLRC